MVKRHLSRLAAPKSWPIERKQNKWIVRPNPGPHSLDEGIPLGLAIRNILHQARTIKEVKSILIDKNILVDKKVRQDYKFPLGVMDVLELPKTNNSYRVLFNKKGKFTLKSINNEESNLKPCKIIGKKIIKGNKIQLNLSDGRNILTDTNDFKVNDTLFLDLTKNKIHSHIKLDKGVFVYITKGKYIGRYGKVVDLEKGNTSKGDKLVISMDKNSIKTLKDYALIIGKDKPMVSLD